MRLIYEELPKGDEVLVEEVTIKYCQETDCTESDDYQTLTLSTRDGEGGKFINISTESWSIDKLEDLTEIINHFKNTYV